jgi:hypothetical protein
MQQLIQLGYLGCHRCIFRPESSDGFLLAGYYLGSTASGNPFYF